MITTEQLDHWFTYHTPPSENAKKRYELIRVAGRVMAEVIIETTPICADQTAAIRKVREAVMTANAALACEGR